MKSNTIFSQYRFTSDKGKSRRKVFFKLCLMLGILSSFVYTSCDSDDVGDNYYTFTGETIGVYITNNPESYSEFSKLLDTTGVKGLLNAYGKYTCFAPDNDAMLAFYESKGRTSLADFPEDTLKKIAYDHIIKDFSVVTDIFVEGFLPYLTMSGRYLDIAIGSSSTGVEYTVNTTAFITIKDIELHNGYIHELDEVLSPTENSLFEAIAADTKFSMFAQGLIETGLNEAVTAIKDDSYVPPADLLELDKTVDGIGGLNRVPREKKYGFTAFIESDSTLAVNGINTIADLKALAKSIYDEVYPQDAGITDVKNRKNSFNRFIAYHLINKKLPRKLIIEKYDNTGWNYETTGETHSVKTYDMFEYIETMCPNTLIEARTDRNTGEYDIFNMIEETGKAIRLTEDYDNDAINGVYHEIDNILAYSTQVARLLSSKKLRMDAASFFPELTNNNIRVGHASPEYPTERWWFPKGYIDRVTTAETTDFAYINADDRFLDYQGDEVWLAGLYDFEVTTLPVPAGTYEVRFGYQPTIFRGAAQLYWDGVPCGIPLDLRLNASDPKIGYVTPGSDATDPDGFENDKMMRNRGYMKGPVVYKVINDTWYSGANARMSAQVVRRILGIYTFTEDGTHQFKVKAARSGEFMFDYLEFVPLEVIENEGVD